MINTLIAIFLLRGRPQDLPASSTLVWLAAGCAAVSDFVVDTLHLEWLTRAGFALSQAILTGAAVWVVLNLRGFPERWMQTVTPIYAASATINLIAWPVAKLLGAPAGEPVSPLLTVIGVGLTVWFIAIFAHVLRHALEWSAGRSVLVALACMLISGLILLVLFPIPGLR